MTRYRERLEAGDFAPPGARAASPEPDAGADLETLTVEELKQALTDQGLPSSGNKAELIARLRGA
jgi:hypothetical protein